MDKNVCIFKPMRIQILGSRGEIEEKTSRHVKHSGVLVDDAILFDLGEKEYLEEKPRSIFFTHLHPDHAYFVRIPETFTYDGNLYAPEESDLAEQIKVLHEPVSIGKYTITPVPVIHSLKVKSQGYIIDDGEKKVLYTGDTAWIEKKHHHLFEGLNLVITDGSFMRKGGMIRRHKESGKIYGHTGIPNLAGMFEDYTPRIIFTHFGKWFMDNVPKAKEKFSKLSRGNLKIEAAYDGMEIIL